MNIGFQDGFHLDDFSSAGEANLASRLRVLRLLDENAIGVLQQRAFEKQERTVFFEGMYQDYVTALKRVTRNTPLRFLGQLTVKNDSSQFLQFFLPLFGSSQESINLGICLAH
jgi:hypothetical protein